MKKEEIAVRDVEDRNNGCLSGMLKLRGGRSVKKENFCKTYGLLAAFIRTAFGKNAWRFMEKGKGGVSKKCR